MNHPDPTLIDALEAEYLALAEKGDCTAIGYALEESDEVNFHAQAILMGVMQVSGTGPSPISVAMWAKIVRERLLEVLTKQVAPQWALREYPKRVEAFQDMAAEWQEEAA